MSGLYEKHEDAGRFIEVVYDVTFANGSVVKKGAKGKVQRVEPAASSLIWIARIAGEPADSERGFYKHQIRFLERKST